MEVRGTIQQFVKGLKHLVKPIYIRLSVRFVRFIEGIHDIRLCGSLLTRDREVNVEGATAYSPTRYWALDEMFADAVFSEDDSFVDIGCGEGRVLAWLIHDKRFSGQITGIEKDPEVAAIAKKWMSRHPNEKVKIIEGDAMEQSYKDYTIVYIFRPFNETFFERLIQRIESQITHPVRFYYLSDNYSRKFLVSRQGWKMIKRQPILKKHGLFLYVIPQFYSIWIYTPPFGQSEC